MGVALPTCLHPILYLEALSGKQSIKLRFGFAWLCCLHGTDTLQTTWRTRGLSCLRTRTRELLVPKRVLGSGSHKDPVAHLVSLPGHACFSL